MILPVAVSTVLKVLNLPNDAKITSVFDEHKDRIMTLLEMFSDTLAWEDLLSESVDKNQQNSYKFAYCYLLLANTIQFLNLKTLGEGIIKTTGFDSNSTELLTGAEIASWQKRLEIDALEMIKEYLSESGYARYRELKMGVRAVGVKACII